MIAIDRMTVGMPPDGFNFTRTGQGEVPDRQQPDDPALREYNIYLAELAKNDAEKQNRTTA